MLDAMLYYFQIHLRHLLAPFPFWHPLIPLSVALLRCVSFTLARMKNSRRILIWKSYNQHGSITKPDELRLEIHKIHLCADKEDTPS